MADHAVRWVDASALADGAAAEPLLDEQGGIREPLLAVDLATAPSAAVVRAAARAAAAADRILVGVGVPPAELRPLVVALDLSLAPVADGREVVGAQDPTAGLDVLATAVTANPQAATVLAGLLRATETLPVREALDMESFAYSTLLGGAEFRTWLDRRGPRPLPPPARADPVLVERRDDELYVTLNRPERRNAFGREVRDALVAALDIALLDDGVRHVTLDGAGPSFCSGGDLDEFGTTPDLVTAHVVRTRGGAGRPLHRLADRIEVRVHGHCVGAGVELPAFAGRIVAHLDTTFRLPEIGMGLVPGAGGTVGIPRRIGRWRALYLALTGIPVDAPTALGWGLVDELTAATEQPSPSPARG